MRLLLDTHTVLWWLGEPERLPRQFLEAICSTENMVYLSAVVIWEIRIKESIGKLRLPDRFFSTLEQEQFEELAVTVSHAHALKTLPSHHQDPFDRMLISQAIEEDLIILSMDKKFRDYDIQLLS